MIAIPAIDLRDGACVQLVGGVYEDERVRLPDPAAVARQWIASGFRRLHVVDLDAATGCGDNWACVERLLELPVAIQVGGGLGTDDRLDRVLRRGADMAIVGTRAVEDHAWLQTTTVRHPGRLFVAADVRGRQVVARGWAAGTGIDVFELLTVLDPLDLAGLLVTAVHREGRLVGPDLDLIDGLVARTRHPIHAAGGIASINDLRALRRAGAAGAVIGMALYLDALDPTEVAKEFPA